MNHTQFELVYAGPCRSAAKDLDKLSFLGAFVTKKHHPAYFCVLRFF